MMLHRKILVIEDETAIAEAIYDCLIDEEYEPVLAQSGETGLELLEAQTIDLILLDIRLPGIDGFTVCRSIREKGYKLPIIIVSARDDVVDRVLGLEMGADDYIIKPFSLRELLSRIKAQLRRAYGDLAHDNDMLLMKQQNVVRFGEISFNRKALRAAKNGQDVFLTPIEVKLLLYFLDNLGQVLTREQIMEHVWGTSWNPDDLKTINVHIRHLREKIEPVPSDPVYLITVRGYGYRFELEK